MRVERPPLLFPILPAICESRIEYIYIMYIIPTSTWTHSYRLIGPTDQRKKTTLSLRALSFNFQMIFIVYKLADHTYKHNRRINLRKQTDIELQDKQRLKLKDKDNLKTGNRRL